MALLICNDISARCGSIRICEIVTGLMGKMGEMDKMNRSHINKAMTMTVNNPLENRLLEKVKKLSAEQIQQVEQFIDFLTQENTDRQLTLISTKLSESVFNKIWDNPEDAHYDNL